MRLVTIALACWGISSATSFLMCIVAAGSLPYAMHVYSQSYFDPPHILAVAIQSALLFAVYTVGRDE